jgi:hypothetical protein
MEHNKQKKKIYKGGDIVRFEPQGLQLLDSNPIFRESFQAVGCLTFCEKLQGGHMEVAKQFSLNFDGVKMKVGSLEIQVTEQTIAQLQRCPCKVRGGSRGCLWIPPTVMIISSHNFRMKTCQKGCQGAIC